MVSYIWTISVIYYILFKYLYWQMHISSVLYVYLAC